MAPEAGVSPSTVGRVWASAGLKPHRIKSFKLSNDKHFEEKLEDVVGLYLSPPEHAKVLAWQKRHRRFHIHFTPTSASWLNMVERFFRDLTEKGIRRGVFRDVPELIKAIETYLDAHNGNPKPFVWTAAASDILEKVKRGRAKLNKSQSA